MSEQLILPGLELVAEAPPQTNATPETIFLRAFRRLGLRRSIPEFQIEFCPFAGLRSTICLRENHVQVKISDLLVGAPPLVLEALAEILLSQVYRRKVSREARECYLAHIFKPSMRDRIDAARRSRGGKRMLPARGRHFDLEEIFAQLNQKYFRGELGAARVGWSRAKSKRTLGNFDAAHRAITITRWLDSPSAPRSLVEYVMFHEMLHMQFPTERNGHRRVVHSPQFRKAEKSFPQYHQAMRQLKKLTESRRASLD